MIDKITSIQIIGTQRSGSNLLRLILNQFQEISAPHPPHVLKTFIPLEGHYGELQNKENFKSLADDIARFVNANPVPWNSRHITTELLIDKAKDQTLIALYEALYKIKAIDDEAKVWCCKSMFNEYYFEQIERKGIKPFYIYLYRDGRDVAVSFKKSIVGPKHVYHIAQKWLADQQKAQDIRRNVEPERFYLMSYESLITEPEATLKKLCQELNLTYRDDLLNYYLSQDSKRTASSGEMWKNVAKPIISTNRNKYLQYLSREEIKIFEKIAGKMLIELGYSLSNPEELHNFEITQEEITRFGEMNRAEIKNVIAGVPEHDRKLRRAQEEVLASIKAKLNLA
jgi:hypothetical protein